ncbi:MAG: SEC-C domain-containing protein [Chromatiales bacterium]|nr:SEC-C domain-containing protein [Chromatiales bacterium]
MQHGTYFEKFLEDTVNLNKSRIDKLKQHVNAITDFIAENHSSYQAYSNQGSYALKTIIKPVDDNDEFDADILVFIKDSNFNPHLYRTDYVEQVYRVFKDNKTYKDKVKKNTRCVTIEYTGDFHLDVVPCIEHNGNHYICNPKDKKYEETDGDSYKKWLLEKNKTVGAGSNNFRKTTKLLKYLRDHKNTFSVKSILLTTLLGNQVYDNENDEIFPDLPTTLKTLSTRLNRFLQTYTTMPIITNPALISENFNRHWDQNKYQNFRDKIKLYTDKINEAYEETDHNESVKKWREIFGDDFGELKKDESSNSNNTKTAATTTLVTPTVAAKKPYATDKNTEKVRSFKPFLDELQKIKEFPPTSIVYYQKDTNTLAIDLKVLPCHYVEDKTQISGWVVKHCDTNAKGVITGEYAVIIDLKTGRVYEFEGKIKQIAKELKRKYADLHLYPNGSCCLGIDIEKKKKSLSEFVINDVFPYFVWQAYYAKYKEIPPVGEYSHGSKGLKEAQNDYESTMVHPRKAGAHRNKPCPCGSGKKYKKCCWIKDNKMSITLGESKRSSIHNATSF